MENPWVSKPAGEPGTITVEGYGVIDVEIPEELLEHEDIFMDSVAKVVAQTCHLMKPNLEGQFHPVLGFANGS